MSEPLPSWVILRVVKDGFPAIEKTFNDGENARDYLGWCRLALGVEVQKFYMLPIPKAEDTP